MANSTSWRSSSGCGAKEASDEQPSAGMVRQGGVDRGGHGPGIGRHEDSCGGGKARSLDSGAGGYAGASRVEYAGTEGSGAGAAGGGCADSRGGWERDAGGPNARHIDIAGRAGAAGKAGRKARPTGAGLELGVGSAGLLLPGAPRGAGAPGPRPRAGEDTDGIPP